MRGEPAQVGSGTDGLAGLGGLHPFIQSVKKPASAKLRRVRHGERRCARTPAPPARRSSSRVTSAHRRTQDTDVGTRCFRGRLSRDSGACVCTCLLAFLRSPDILHLQGKANTRHTKFLRTKELRSMFS